MRTFEEILNEEITKTKLQKIYNQIQKKIFEDPQVYRDFQKIDCNDLNEVESFIENVIGEPKGIWKNTKEEQVKLLKRVISDYEDERGIDFVRPDWSGDSGTF